MSERDDLMTKLQQILITYNIPLEDLRAKLYLALDPYEIQQRSTELVVADEETTEKYITAFLVNKRVAGRTDNTLRFYRLTLAMFFRECPKLPTEVTSDDIKKFFAIKEVRDGSSRVYIKDLSRVLSSFYQWMLKEEYISKNPFNKIEDIKLPKVKKHAFTEMQIETLRASIEPDDIRLSLIFEILLSTWCRVSELAGMKITDFSENKDSVLVHGKGQKDRICYLNAKSKLLLSAYLECRKDSNPYLIPKCKYGLDILKHMKDKSKKAQRNWWQNKELVTDNEPVDKSTIESHIRKLGRKAGVENTHPHRFRRTGATFALRRGMPIEQVSKLLGHESLETTQIYLDISESELEQSHKKYV